MRIPPKPTDEADRLDALAGYNIMDTGAEDMFDRITRLAARMFDVPVALISLVADDRLWCKSHHGMAAEEMSRDMAFCAYTILHDRVLVVPDATKDPQFSQNPAVRHDPYIRFYAGAPLVTPEGFNIGSLCVIDTRPREMSPEDREALSDMAGVVVQAFEWRRIASIDPVTELPNRRFFEDALSRERKRAQRNGRSITVVMIALDRLAMVTEEFGAGIGKQILQRVAQLLRGQLRDSDLLVRYGAREFAVLLPDTDSAGAGLVAEHLRNELELASFMTEKGDFSVTASLGVAQCDPSTESVGHTLTRASKATRQAGETGGNRIEVVKNVGDG
ncbi:MAG TPA: sensor domain-containing diguanylate cyclase [Alphaproteobacteria bacterium]|nr:sensor domain-containing diguanylate cyclase [Alphaproteobacteria bacterium]